MYRKIQGYGIPEIISWIGTSALWVSVLCFLILSLLRGHSLGSLQQVAAKWPVLLVSILSSLKAYLQSGCNVVV